MLEIDLDLPKPPSLNQYYAGKHWAIRKKQKDEYSKFCKEELEKFDAFTCESYEIHIGTTLVTMLTTLFLFQNFSRILSLLWVSLKTMVTSITKGLTSRLTKTYRKILSK